MKIFLLNWRQCFYGLNFKFFRMSSPVYSLLFILFFYFSLFTYLFSFFLNKFQIDGMAYAEEYSSLLLTDKYITRDLLEALEKKENKVINKSLYNLLFVMVNKEKENITSIDEYSHKIQLLQQNIGSESKNVPEIIKHLSNEKERMESKFAFLNKERNRLNLEINKMESILKKHLLIKERIYIKITKKNIRDLINTNNNRILKSSSSSATINPSLQHISNEKGTTSSNIKDASSSNSSFNRSERTAECDIWGILHITCGPARKDSSNRVDIKKEKSTSVSESLTSSGRIKKQKTDVTLLSQLNYQEEIINNLKTQILEKQKESKEKEETYSFLQENIKENNKRIEDIKEKYKKMQLEHESLKQAKLKLILENENIKISMHKFSIELSKISKKRCLILYLAELEKVQTKKEKDNKQLSKILDLLKNIYVTSPSLNNSRLLKFAASIGINTSSNDNLNVEIESLKYILRLSDYLEVLCPAGKTLSYEQLKYLYKNKDQNKVEEMLRERFLSTIEVITSSILGIPNLRESKTIMVSNVENNLSSSISLETNCSARQLIAGNIMDEASKLLENYDSIKSYLIPNYDLLLPEETICLSFMAKEKFKRAMHLDKLENRSDKIKIVDRIIEDFLDRIVRKDLSMEMVINKLKQEISIEMQTNRNGTVTKEDMQSAFNAFKEYVEKYPHIHGDVTKSKIMSSLRKYLIKLGYYLLTKLTLIFV